MTASPTAGRFRQAAAAGRATWRTPNLRRAQLSFGGAFTAEWALPVALGVLAYRDGGATAVGIVAMARMVPSVIVAPLIAGVLDRCRRERVLVTVCLVRGTALAAAALSVGILDLTTPAYVCAAVATLAHTLYRPAHSALLPSLCTTPAALTSANVVRGLLDSLSALVGPLFAAGLIAVADVEVALLGAAVAAGWAGWMIARVDFEAPPRVEDVVSSNPLRDLRQSAAVIRRQPAVGVLCLLFCVQTFTRGCFSVFAVVISIRLLNTGEAGVGSIAVPGLIALLDPRGALVVAGLVAPITVALCWWPLMALDRTLVVEGVLLDRRQRLDMFRPLPASGAIVVEQGTVGDDVFVLAEGSVDVLVDGEVANHLDVGDCFGEIAALDGGTRSSTVRARTPLMLHRLPGHTFLSVVTGYTPSRGAAEILVGARLAHATPADRP